MISCEEVDNSILIDLLFETNLSNKEIAEELCMTQKELSLKMKTLGLAWLRKRKGYASRGQAVLTHLMRKLIPGETIICEHHLGDRLRLDVFCPKYNLAAEFHGRQHFEYVDHFHRNSDGFKTHKERDIKKEEMCRQQGIVLVVFRYNDVLTETAVFERLLEALQTAVIEKPEENKKTLRGNPYYEAAKQRRREYQRNAYRKMKGESGRYQRKAT